MNQILSARSCERCIHYRAVTIQEPPKCARFVVTDCANGRSDYIEASSARSCSSILCGEQGRYFVPYFPCENGHKR